ncbi:MAG: hypothetical protein ABI643_02770 [Candidatus Doudnabacteria bacterium]
MAKPGQLGYPPVSASMVDKAKLALLGLAGSFEKEIAVLLAKRDQVSAKLSALRSARQAQFDRQEFCAPVNTLINTARSNFQNFQYTCAVMNRFYEITSRLGPLAKTFDAEIKYEEEQLAALDAFIAKKTDDASELFLLSAQVGGILDDDI